jgi:glycine dehydrogenase subunit 2
MNKYPKLLFEKSMEGKVGFSFSYEGYKSSQFQIDSKNIRKDIPDFPQLSEIEIVRHYTNLSSLNHSVDKGFYPLGSCTMKYNPKINDKIAGLDNLSAHPYSPVELVQGNLEIIHELSEWLINLTGLPHYTLSPAAGAHGEFLGIMVIKKCLQYRGDARKIILMPDSAHGTNPASAHLAGYKVKEIPSNADGIIEPDILKEYLNEDVAALMVTNPNTLGIFEKHIRKIADILHANGSLLYMDGANMNAFLGIFKPGDVGVDVLHLNLHKTFSTPHGGGGPGSGPVGVCEELGKFLPLPLVSKNNGRFEVNYKNETAVGRIKNYFGNFLVLVRALAYLKSLGRENIRRVAEDAVLNANYIRTKLKNYLDLPYESKTLHEVIFSDKDLPVSTMHIAKRLLDYGIHPFTMYFPLIVHGAMMIEPTETESKQTLDEFIEAVIDILREAKTNKQLIETAPHTTPLGRLDETLAARNPILKWEKTGGK